MNDQSVKDLYRQCLLEQVLPQTENAIQVLNAFMANSERQRLINLNKHNEARELWHRIKVNAQKLNDLKRVREIHLVEGAQL